MLRSTLKFWLLLRVLTEGAFIKISVADTVQQIMPKLLGIDAINNMIALEI
jgi:5-methylthioribose kinase